MLGTCASVSTDEDSLMSVVQATMAVPESGCCAPHAATVASHAATGGSDLRPRPLLSECVDPASHVDSGFAAFAGLEVGAKGRPRGHGQKAERARVADGSRDVAQRARLVF